MRTRAFTSLVIGPLLLAAAAGAHGQVTKSGSGYLLRMKFTPGQVMRYDVNVNVVQDGRPLTIVMPLVNKVVSVANGVGTLESKTGPTKMVLNGRPMKDLPVMTSIVRIDSRATRLGGSGTGGPGMTSIPYPAGPLRIGGTWSGKTKTTVGAMGEMEVEGKYKLAGLQSIGGRQTMKITIAMKGVGNARVVGNQTMWIAVADGSLVKCETDMDVTIGTKTVPMKMSVVRK